MTPLPTSATTAKQTAAKAAKTRRENPKEENPYHLPVPKTHKAVKLPIIPDSEISAELLDHFHELGYTRDEIKTTAGAWLITQAELRQWEAKIDQADQAERDRIDLETAKLGAQLEACVLNRGHVRTEAILNATPEQLHDYADYYEDTLDELYPQLVTAPDGTAEKAAHQATWDRLNQYLWECKQQSGIGPVVLRNITKQDLDTALDEALEGAGHGQATDA